MIEDYVEPQVKLDLWGGTSGMYQGFDRFGRVVDHRWRDYAFSVDADRIQHGYDRASNRLWRANPVAAAQNPAVHLDELYQYDGVSQLVGLERGQLIAGRDAITTKTFGEDWALDATGNWTAFRQDLGGDGTWDLDQTRAHNRANEITSASSWTTAAHDRAGNMISMPKPGSPADALATTFDAWNRMVKVEDGEDTVAEYAYTGDNRRTVRKTYSGGALSETRHFYYTDQWQAIEERTASGGTVADDPDCQYVWGPQYVDHLILRDRQTTTSGAVTERLYALRDANWNVTALVDILGNPIERFTYTAYGTMEVRTPLFQLTGAPSLYAWPYTYTTRRLDEETGLMYYRNRMYHPELGRFVSRDPVGYAVGDFNLYSYCNSSPNAHVDASGEQPAFDPFSPPPPPTSDAILKLTTKQKPHALNKYGPAAMAQFTFSFTYRAGILGTTTPNGWIIVFLSFDYTQITDCDGKPLLKAEASRSMLEAWEVKNGIIYPGSSGQRSFSTDTWQFTQKDAPDSIKGGTKGSWSMQGWIGFVKDYELRSPPWRMTPRLGSGTLMTLDPALMGAAGLKYQKPSEYRGFVVEWCSCPKDDQTEWTETQVTPLGTW